MSISKFVGGLLLIVGTSIGGGMLALPIATAQAGFVHSIFFLILCWIVMTSGALLVLEVNLRFPPGSNMVTMAKSTLGLPGQIVAWIAYLFLLYSLLAGYISGGSDVLGGILAKAHLPVSDNLTPLIFTSFFAYVVYSGIRAVDYVNRGLMFGKLGVYLLLVLIISPHVSLSKLQKGDISTISQSIMILITSFGFATIVPSLRDYFKGDIPVLRRLIVLGSLIPLICYILWDAVIMGALEHQGPAGLLSLASSEHAISGLAEALKIAVQNPWIDRFFTIFISICMLTAFLGVSLGLFDFLSDGLKLHKTGRQGRILVLVTFLPPLCIVLLYPGIYLKALNYAGFCCVILLLLLPGLMAWRSRKQARTSEIKPMIPGGTAALVLIIAIALILLTVAI